MLCEGQCAPNISDRQSFVFYMYLKNVEIVSKIQHPFDYFDKVTLTLSSIRFYCVTKSDLLNPCIHWSVSC